MANVSQTAAATRAGTLRTAALLCALAAGFTAPQLKGQEFFPLKDIRRGMHGVGRTIFEGNRVEEFQVEILGILENAGPKQSIILARLSGGPLAEAGIIQGMSGSPVYIDGKLVGAVALGFAFSKEPIAGIQPIEQMTADGTFTNSGGSTMAGLTSAVSGSAANLTQILTPLALSGFTQRTLEAFGPQFRRLGFDPEQAVASGAGISHELTAPVVPGSMISVQLVSGDMSVGADGTVTYVKGNRVYAFGHRFLDVGATELPFARAEVIAVVPTLNTSFKLSTPKEWAGVILSDRSTGIAGELGRAAHTLPATIDIHSAMTGTHSYHVDVVNDRLLTPFLTQTAVFSAIDATEHTLGSGTIRLHTRIEFDGGLPSLDLHDIFVSDSGLAAQVANDAVTTLAFLLSAGFDTLHVKNMNFDIEPTQAKRQLYITQAWTSAHEVKPGDAVTITVRLAGENGVALVRDAVYRVPVGAPLGQLNFTVSDANTQNFPDFAGMNASSAHTPAELIGMLNQYRGAEAAYVRVWRSEPAFTIAGPSPGGELTDPPPSVMLVLADPSESPTSNTAQLNTRGSSVAEFRLPVDGYVVSGAKTVQVEVKE